MAAKTPLNTMPARSPPRSPAISTSAQATPSGYLSLPCSLTMSARRSGIMNNTPSVPPTAARTKMVMYLKYSAPPDRNSIAGIVNTTPAATDSPAEPIVWTMLFSRIVDLPSFLKTAIERTAIGTEAETVSPARRARYTVAAPKMMPKAIPSRIALSENSGISCSAEMYGLNSAPDSMSPPVELGAF